MGLYERDYMREEESRQRRVPSAPWSPTIALLVVLVVVFLIQSFLHMRNSVWMEANLALSLTGIREGRVWQLLTFQFLHGGILHLLLNGFTLYSFGRVLQTQLGNKRFLLLFFLSGTCGGLLQVIATWLLRQPAWIPVVGASAGIAGLVAAFIMCNPEARLIIFPIPFPVRAWTVLWVVLGVSIFGTVFPFGGIAHAGHLGGLLAGGAFMRWLWRAPRQRDPDWLLPKNLNPKPGLRVESTRDPADAEVDAILDKISAHGIQSLTDRERAALDRARAKMNKR